MIASKAIDVGHFQIINPYLRKNGVFDISNEDYHASLGINRSAIMEFNKTPFHFWNKYLNENAIQFDQASSPSMKMGSLLHIYTMEPEKFDSKYLLVEKKDRRTKEGKAYYEEINKILNGREMIDADEFEQVKLMSESLHANQQIHDLMTGAQYEKSLYWNDPHTGLLCKARPDIWHDGFICDLKTTANARLRDFIISTYTYGYHIQCAMLYLAFKNIFNIEMKDFIFIVIENTYPYACAIYPLDAFSLEKSVEIVQNKLIDIHHCYIKNEWPGYKTQIITLPTFITNGE